MARDRGMGDLVAGWLRGQGLRRRAPPTGRFAQWTSGIAERWLVKIAGLQVLRAQTGTLRNFREDYRPKLLFVMIREAILWPAVTSERSM